MENLRERAAELRRQGLTRHRAFRVLKREFPHAERDVLVIAAGLNGATPGLWVDGPTSYFDNPRTMRTLDPSEIERELGTVVWCASLKKTGGSA